MQCGPGLRSNRVGKGCGHNKVFFGLCRETANKAVQKVHSIIQWLVYFQMATGRLRCLLVYSNIHKHRGISLTIAHAARDSHLIPALHWPLTVVKEFKSPCCGQVESSCCSPVQQFVSGCTADHALSHKQDGQRLTVVCISGRVTSYIFAAPSLDLSTENLDPCYCVSVEH